VRRLHPGSCGQPWSRAPTHTSACCCSSPEVPSKMRVLLTTMRVPPAVSYTARARVVLRVQKLNEKLQGGGSILEEWEAPQGSWHPKPALTSQLKSKAVAVAVAVGRGSAPVGQVHVHQKQRAKKKKKGAEGSDYQSGGFYLV